MKKFFLFLTLFMISISYEVSSQLYECKTYCYSDRGDISLYMDVYSPVKIKSRVPCMLFLSGGGFTNVNRRDARYFNYIEHLLTENIMVVSIDYRLGMKTGEIKPWQYPDALELSVKIAIEDLLEAVGYLLKNKDSLNIDRDKIMVSGSSAGAIIALGANFALQQNFHFEEKHPLKGFNFACVISFAGGLYLSNKNKKQYFKYPPTLLFHGGKDKIVTPNLIEIFDESFLGSSALADIFESNHTDYFYRFYPDLGHEVSYKSMSLEHDLISEFLYQYVLDK